MKKVVLLAILIISLVACNKNNDDPPKDYDRFFNPVIIGEWSGYQTDSRDGYLLRCIFREDRTAYTQIQRQKGEGQEIDYGYYFFGNDSIIMLMSDKEGEVKGISVVNFITSDSILIDKTTVTRIK